MPVTHRSHLLDPEQDTALVGAGEAFQGEEQAAASRSISGSKQMPANSDTSESTLVTAQLGFGLQIIAHVAYAIHRWQHALTHPRTG